MKCEKVKVKQTKEQTNMFRHHKRKLKSARIHRKWKPTKEKNQIKQIHTRFKTGIGGIMGGSDTKWEKMNPNGRLPLNVTHDQTRWVNKKQLDKQRAESRQNKYAFMHD